jgi:site-specific DNA recombinase
MPQRAVLYARVSGDDRHTEGRNLAGQLALGRQYAIEHGYTIVAELAEDDRGASGAAFELPQLNRVRELAQAGACDVLIVRELDRLSRDLLKQLLVEDELKRTGVAIEYVLGEYPDTPEGRLNKHIRATIAEYEREKIRERTTQARLRAVAAGSVVSHGLAVYGYRVVREGAKLVLVIEPEEAAVVVLIYDLYLHGPAGGAPLSAIKIAEALTERRIPTAVDKGLPRRKVRGYGVWSPASVGKILADETYAGVWHYRKHQTVRGPDGEHHRYTRPPAEWLPVTVPALIDRATWEAVAQRRAHNKLAAARNLQQPDLYLLRSRVVCGRCGVRMRGVSPTAGKPHAYYRCPATERRSNYAHRCTAHSFRADKVDARVWTWLRSLIEHPAVLEAGREELQEREARAGAPLAVALAAAERDLADVLQQAERLLAAYLAGAVDLPAFEKANGPLQTAQAQAAERRRELAAAQGVEHAAEHDLASARAFADSLAAELPAVADVPAFRRFVAEKLDLQAALIETERGPGVRVRCKLLPAPVLLYLNV